MKIIKLSAIESTNAFLKQKAQLGDLNDTTVAVTDNQTKGRGQMETKWLSEPHKNLTFSVFKKFNKLQINEQPYLNFAVCLAVLDALKELKVPNLSIKWPNDIMAGDQKLCGILIEATFKQKTIKNTILGIGLNVNQTIFPKELPNATSLKKVLNKEFELEVVLKTLLKSLKAYLKFIENHQFNEIYTAYQEKLYKKGITTTFIDLKKNKTFKASIEAVSKKGYLILELDEGYYEKYGTKEIKFASSIKA